MCSKKQKTSDPKKSEPSGSKGKAKDGKAAKEGSVAGSENIAGGDSKTKPVKKEFDHPTPKVLIVTDRIEWGETGAFAECFPGRMDEKLEVMMDHSFDYGCPRVIRDCWNVIWQAMNSNQPPQDGYANELISDIETARRLEGGNVPLAILAGLEECCNMKVTTAFCYVRQRVSVSESALAALLWKNIERRMNIFPVIDELADNFFMMVNEESIQTKGAVTIHDASIEKVLIGFNRALHGYYRKNSNHFRSRADFNCYVSYIIEVALMVAEVRCYGWAETKKTHEEHLASDLQTDDGGCDYILLSYLYGEGTPRMKFMLFLSRFIVHQRYWIDETKRRFTLFQPRIYNILKFFYNDLGATATMEPPVVFKATDREAHLMYRLQLYSNMGLDLDSFLHYNAMSSFPGQTVQPAATNNSLKRIHVAYYLLHYYSNLCHQPDVQRGMGILPHTVRNWIVRGQFRKRDGSLDPAPIEKMMLSMETSKVLFRMAQVTDVVIRLIRKAMARTYSGESSTSTQVNLKLITATGASAQSAEIEAMVKENLINHFSTFLTGYNETIQKQLLSILIDNYFEVVPTRSDITVEGPFLPMRKDLPKLADGFDFDNDNASIKSGKTMKTSGGTSS